MLSSKANAALARLKEIEEKYKIKREEQKWNKEDLDSSISSVSMIPSENLSAEELKKGNVSKLKLNIKIPDTRFEGHADETKLSSESKKSTPDRMSPETRENVDENADDLDVAAMMPSKDKSPRSAGKQESPVSDVATSIQENSSIESVHDDSMTSSKSLSRSKTPRRNFSAASDKSSRREKRTKAAAKSSSEKGKEFDRSSGILGNGKASSDNSSSTTLKDKAFNKVRAGPRSREEKLAVKVPKSANFDQNLDRSRSLRDDSVIEESIDTMEDSSEIISELSRAAKRSVTARTEDSVKNSKHLAAENAPATMSSSSRELAIESGYANDTFEDISTSTMLSQSQRKKIIDDRKKIELAGSSAKKIDTASFEQRNSHKNIKSNRNGQIIEYVASKSNVTEINFEPFDYTNNLESNANSGNAIVRLIKSPKSIGSRPSRSGKHYQQHRRESFKENISNATSSDENISNSETLTGDMTKTDKKKNSPEIRMTVRQESGQEDRGKVSNKIRERAVINIARPPAADEEDIIIKSSSSKENEKVKENFLEENSDQRISREAEDVLRKLHKDAFDALIRRYMSEINAKKSRENFVGSKVESRVKDAMKMRKEMPREENESHCSSDKNKASDHTDHKPSSQKKKRSVKVISKSAQARNSTGNHKEDEEALRFDEKQMYRLRKRIVELRVRQEREDLQKYLKELKNSKLESTSTPSYFSPLEFPKIAEFTQPDAIDLKSQPDDQHVALRERVSAIRRRLKDQYILYRDYCTMAQAINAQYVPTTLQDAKKTIRELRKTTVKNR